MDISSILALVPSAVASLVPPGHNPGSLVPNGITSGDESAQRATSDAIWHKWLWIAARRHEWHHRRGHKCQYWWCIDPTVQYICNTLHYASVTITSSIVKKSSFMRSIIFSLKKATKQHSVQEWKTKLKFLISMIFMRNCNKQTNKSENEFHIYWLFWNTWTNSQSTPRGVILFRPPGVILEIISRGGVVHRRMHIIMY